MPAGLVYIRLPDNATSAQPRASTIFFILMLNAITPISYMAFYNSDKRFFEMDSANGLYAPSAYYMAAAAAGWVYIFHVGSAKVRLIPCRCRAAAADCQCCHARCL